MEYRLRNGVPDFAAHAKFNFAVWVKLNVCALRLMLPWIVQV
jgi:hypothetical protein